MAVLADRPARLCLVAVLLAGAVYLNALSNPFVYDDVRVIEQNRSLDAPSLHAVFFQNPSRPLVNLSYVVDRAVWGRGPFGFHLTSLLIHMANVALLFLVAWGITCDRRGHDPPGVRTRRAAVAGFVAAVLFAVHPMMTQAVGYVSGRSELLCTLFVLVAFAAVRRWMNTDRVRWLALVVASFFLALASKETAIVLPLLLPFYGLVVRDEPPAARRRHLLLLWTPLLAVAVVGAAVRLGLFVFIEYAGTIDVQWRYLLTEVDVFTRYVALMAAPRGQTIFHAIPATTSFVDPRAVVALVTAAIYVAVVVVAARARSVASLGLFWFAAALLPSAALVLFDRGEPMAEHRVYTASAGLFLAVGTFGGFLAHVFAGARPVVRAACVAALAVVILSLAGRTVVRNAVWSSPVLLWAEAADHAPGHWLPALVLGESLHDVGRHGDAIGALERALAIRDDIPAIYEHLGVCQLETEAFDEAVATFTALAERVPASPAASNGLATVALLRGDIEAARRGFLRTLDIDPRSIQARRGLVAVEEGPGGQPEDAVRRCEEIQVLAPGDPGAAACLERHRARTGRD